MAEKLPAYATPDQIPLVVNNLTSDSTTDALSAAQGKALNSNINTYRDWKEITGIQENVETQIATSYREIYIEGTFSSGQRICFLVIPGARQDSGFYYNSNACGSGAVSLTGSYKLTIFHPYYGGSSTTFSSIRIWGR